ncbi:3 5-cyclic nucleotide phosphodiesterase family protein [Stylonychia lemnae]|uniref:Phosphodiesterase n=1 Tax=Stylonychia lemnae TaxID=5949 RepID=A0A078AU20_STYLE|nr:3 5-cyclic nucleotide phosphodiesterase family protein [Stylonychia lemnae]|eukprot:CDW84348.1 3 5-cyclic nucleotide phosphodiesterase family protein [Stylonychia lemnae]
MIMTGTVPQYSMKWRTITLQMIGPQLALYTKEEPSKVRYLRFQYVQNNLIGLKELQIFLKNPVIVGFVRLRCIIRVPYIWLVIYQHIEKKVTNRNNNKHPQGYQAPIFIQKSNFKTYKDKVLYILNSIYDSLGGPQELSWCLHVIKNDFLQISNSLLSTTGARRFSKTQRIITYDDGIEAGVINSWITVLLNANFSLNNPLMSSNALLTDPKSNRLSDYPVTKDIMQFEQLINSNEFDAFELHSVTKKNSLYFMLQYMYQRFDLENQMGINASKFQVFSMKLQATYRDNPYHNPIHAADVVQNVFLYLSMGGAQEICRVQTFDIAGLVISAAAHDVDHPGNNNLFEIKSKSKLATLYNDQAVLENHHTATFFFLIEDEGCNIFETLRPDEINKMRKYIIDNILYTDMTKHFAFIGELKSMPDKADYDPTEKHKYDIMKALVHAADVGNPARPFELCKLWALKIVQEFFQQGDKEKAMGLEISLLCDRKTTNLGKSQIGFIDFVVLPYFDAIARILPDMSYCCDQLRQNKLQWASTVDFYEKLREETGNEKI